MIKDPRAVRSHSSLGSGDQHNGLAQSDGRAARARAMTDAARGLLPSHHTMFGPRDGLYRPSDDDIAQARRTAVVPLQ